MPPHHNILHDRMMAVPNTAEHNSNVTNHNAHCDRSCTIALATVLPAIALIIIGTITYLAWGRPYLERRKRDREERQRVERKLGGGEEESVASSDVSSLDGGVHGLNEERTEEGRDEGRAEVVRETRTQTRRVKEGHEHDHVLAMIVARP
ncbi:MAG: hypothetical protein Q9179_002333 [Wetmoreana sp. 5 TL-2023]